MEAFLSVYGIDITKPDETFPCDNGGSFFYDFAGYTVCGKILNAPSDEIRIEGEKSFMVFCNEGFVFPNEQTEDYFSFSVCDIGLPISERERVVPKKRRIKLFEHRGIRKE